MDNLIQNIESTLSTTVSAIEPKVQTAASVVKPKINSVAAIVSKAIGSFFDWIAAHPKISLVIVIFIMGFLCGILF